MPCRRCLKDIEDTIVARSNSLEDGERVVVEDLQIAEYRGETKANVYTRGLWHLAQYRARNNWMWQHTAEKHGGVMGPNRGIDDYGMEVTSNFTRAMDRQLDEATRISRMEDGLDRRRVMEVPIRLESMQGRGEYYKPKNVRVEFRQL